jgi:hypothetical protein
MYRETTGDSLEIEFKYAKYLCLLGAEEVGKEFFLKKVFEKLPKEETVFLSGDSGSFCNLNQDFSKKKHF